MTVVLRKGTSDIVWTCGAADAAGWEGLKARRAALDCNCCRLLLEEWSPEQPHQLEDSISLGGVHACAAKDLCSSWVHWPALAGVRAKQVAYQTACRLGRSVAMCWHWSTVRYVNFARQTGRSQSWDEDDLSVRRLSDLYLETVWKVKKRWWLDNVNMQDITCIKVVFFRECDVFFKKIFQKTSLSLKCKFTTRRSPYFVIFGTKIISKFGDYEF